jgi:sortase A
MFGSLDILFFMLGKSLGFYALGFAALLSIAGLTAFLVGVSHRDEVSVNRVEPALVSGNLDLAEAPAEEEEVREEEVREEEAPEEEPREEEEQQQVAAVTPPASDALTVTYPNAGIYDNYVSNTSDPAALHQGAIKLPSTGFPWQEGANTYIAGHVLGYAGTGSYMQFAGLPNAQIGDEFYITDANGNTYTYRVFESLTVNPTDVWVTSPIPGKTVASLQTCVGPNYEYRLVVRGELVATDPA